MARHNLQSAALSGDVYAVRVVIGRSPDPLTAARNQLSVAASNGRAAAVRMIVRDLGVDVNAPSASGDLTALHWAARVGHADVAGLLVLELGADVAARDAEGWTALHWAAWAGHADVARLVATFATTGMRTRRGMLAAHLAAMRGHVEVVRLLFVERDFRDRTMTPLHVACASGQVAVARELVEERCVDVNARGPMGRTALHWASMRGHTALVAWLVEMGADEGALDGDGRSPAQVMARRPNCALIEPPLASVRDHP